MVIASAYSTRGRVIAHHLRKSALDDQHLYAFMFEELAHDHRLLGGCVNEPWVYKALAALIEDDSEPILWPTADFVVARRDINALIFCERQPATENWHELKCETHGFHVGCSGSRIMIQFMGRSHNSRKKFAPLLARRLLLIIARGGKRQTRD